MTDSQVPSPPKSPGRGLRIALAVSLALNLAVVGVVGGTMLRHGGPDGPGRPRDLGFGVFSEALTPQDRADLRRRLIASRPGFVEERRGMRQDMATLLAALRADPFDPAALDAAMQAQIARLQKRLDLGQALLRDYLVDMTPEARRAFADRLEAATARGTPRRDRPKDDPANP